MLNKLYILQIAYIITTKELEMEIKIRKMQERESLIIVERRFE